MSHKDYVKIAGALADARRELGIKDSETAWSAPAFAIEAVEVRIARILADDNPAFDFDRFHAAAIGQPLTGRDRPR